MTCENLGLIPANDKFLSLGYSCLKLFGVSRLRQRNKNVGRHINLTCLDKLRLEHKMQDFKTSIHSENLWQTNHESK